MKKNRDKKFKKGFASFLMLIMMFAFSACGDIGNSSETLPSNNSIESTTSKNNSEIQNQTNSDTQIYSSNSDSCDFITINGTPINIENCGEYFLSPIQICLKYNWGNDGENQLYVNGNEIFIQRAIENLFERDFGKAMNNSDGYASVTTYGDYLTKYFSFDRLTYEQRLREKASYLKELDSVLISDGLGDVTISTATGFNVDKDIVSIDYNLSDGVISTNSIINIQLTKDGYSYISNTTEFISLYE